MFGDTHPYKAHDAFIEPARASAELWRLCLGILLFVVGYLALSQLYFQLVFITFGDDQAGLYSEILATETPRAVMLLLFSFAAMSITLVLLVRLLHQRSSLGLLGPIYRFVPAFISVSTAMILLALAVFVLPPWGWGVQLHANLPFLTWLMLFPLSVLVLLIQVSAEELVFRGYLQQQLAARFRSPLVWIGLPSFLFGLAHYMPQEAGDQSWLLVCWAGLFGVFVADLTARSGSLAPAIAMHFWNNFSGILIVALKGNFSGLSLYTLPFTLSDTEQVRAWLFVDFAMIFVAWLAARVALRR